MHPTVTEARRGLPLLLLLVLQRWKRPSSSTTTSSSSSKKMRKKKKTTTTTTTKMILLVLTLLLLIFITLIRLLLLNDDHLLVVTSDDPPPRSPYPTHRQIHWDNMIIAASSAATVALLNFSPDEVKRWRNYSRGRGVGGSVVRAVRLHPVDPTVVTWEALYPEWIDENEDDLIANGNTSTSTRSRCPSLPEPRIIPPLHRRFDLVAVNLPCRRNTTRDVPSLHLQLSAAKLALASTTPAAPAAEVLIVSDCLPLPNLFPCKHLVRRHGQARLYRPDARYLRDRIRLPVGSCDLAVRLDDHGRRTSDRTKREAYATVLHSSDAYVCGAIATAQSIRQSGSTRELVALVDYGSISVEQRDGLAAAGWQVRAMERIRNPHAVAGSYNEWNYSKFRLWQLSEYDKVVFVDADQLVLRNIDLLFEAAELSATGNSRTLFNSGVMVVEPCNCTFEMLMSRVEEIRSYNGGDQGYLNEVFTWWHRLPRRLNVLKYYHNQSVRGALVEEKEKEKEEPEPYVVHYLGIKPWLCFRDYDCNWNVPWLRRFASDEAHARWWAVHDRIMPVELVTRFCALPATQKVALEYDRRQAEMANATDMHWTRAITDPRIN